MDDRIDEALNIASRAVEDRVFFEEAKIVSAHIIRSVEKQYAELQFAVLMLALVLTMLGMIDAHRSGRLSSQQRH